MTGANIVGQQFQVCADHWVDIEVISRISGRVEHVGDCHIIEGYRNKNGHVKVENHGKPVWAHRAVFAFWHGPLLPGEVVCHRCDVGACVNPDHLFRGSQAVNVADMNEKGRGVAPPVRSGQANHKATLTDADVDRLRAMATEPRQTQRSLARAFGVSQSTVFRIVKGQTRNG